MRWAIDLDDVTVAFIEGLKHAHWTEFNEEMPIVGTWTTPLATLSTHGLRAAGYKNAWEWLKDREWLWANFQAVPGAIGGIQALRAQGHYVEAVTSKPQWAEHNVWKWLGKWRPAFNRVTIVNSKQRKVDMTDAQVIVDDKYETCLEFALAGRQAVWFAPKLFDYTDVRIPQGLHIANNWDEVIGIAAQLTILDNEGVFA